jgi:hypothetical protein
MDVPFAPGGRVSFAHAACYERAMRARGRTAGALGVVLLAVACAGAAGCSADEPPFGGDASAASDAASPGDSTTGMDARGSTDASADAPADAPADHDASLVRDAGPEGGPGDATLLDSGASEVGTGDAVADGPEVDAGGLSCGQVDPRAPVTVIASGIQPDEMHVADGYAYYRYSSTGTQTDSIGRVPLTAAPGDASSAEVVAPPQPSILVRFAADGARVYFTSANGAVSSCPVSGCGSSPTLLASLQTSPGAIATNGSVVVWSDEGSGSTATIESCPVTGCGAGPLEIAHDIVAADPLVVDASNVYWADADGAVWKCPLLGCGSGPTKLAIDPGIVDLVTDGANLYWTVDQRHVAACAVGGCGGVPTILWSSPSAIGALATDGESVYWVTDSKQVYRCAPAGCRPGPVQVVSHAPDPIALLAASAGTLYVAGHSGGQTGSLSSCPACGCDGAPTLLAETNAARTTVAANSRGAYFSSTGPDAIVECDYGGCGGRPAQIALVPSVTSPCAADAASCAAGAVGVPDLAVDDGTLLFLAHDTRGPSADVEVTSLPGGSPSTLAPATESRFLAYDGTYAYWSSSAGIQRCARSGCASGPQVLVPPSSLPDGVSALAVGGQAVYWAECPGSGSGQIRSCPFTGCSGGPGQVAATPTCARAMTADATHLYWMDDGTAGAGYADGTLWSAPLAGGSAVRLATVPLDQSEVSVLASDGAWVYFTALGWLPGTAGYGAANTASLERVPAGGGTVQTVASWQDVPASLSLTPTAVVWSARVGVSPGPGSRVMLLPR